MSTKLSSSDVLYSRKDHKRVRNLLKLQFACLTIVGLTPYVLVEYFPRKLRSLACFLACLHGAFFTMLSLHLALLYIKTAYDRFQNEDFDGLTDALTQLNILWFGVFSSCFWLLNSKKLRSYATFLNNNYMHHSIAGLTFVSSYQAYMRAYRMSFLWLASAIYGASLFGITPLIRGLHTLPLDCWYPFDPLRPRIYPFIYCIQLLTQIYLSFSIVMASAFYVSLIVLMLGQFDVLFCSLKNLEHHAQLLCGEKVEYLRQQQRDLRVPEDDELNQYMLSEEHLTDLSIFRQLPVRNGQQEFNLRLALHESLVKCVKLHQFIRESCKKFENIFSPLCLVRSLQLSFQLCLLIFAGVTGERSFLRVFNLFQYLALSLIDLILYTYWAELLLQHSVRAGDTLWRSNWVSYAKLIRKDIMIFLINSQRPIRLTAGKFFTMDIDRLRLVLMQAFSFLTVLQKLKSKNK